MPHFISRTSDEQRVLAFRSHGQEETIPAEESRKERIRIKNRRMRYLDLNPGYFTSADLELAGNTS